MPRQCDETVTGVTILKTILFTFYVLLTMHPGTTLGK